MVHFNLIISIGLRCVDFFYICKGATIYIPGGGGVAEYFLNKYVQAEFCEIINCLKDKNEKIVILMALICEASLRTGLPYLPYINNRPD